MEGLHQVNLIKFFIQEELLLEYYYKCQGKLDLEMGFYHQKMIGYL